MSQCADPRDPHALLMDAADVLRPLGPTAASSWLAALESRGLAGRRDGMIAATFENSLYLLECLCGEARGTRGLFADATVRGDVEAARTAMASAVRRLQGDGGRDGAEVAG